MKYILLFLASAARLAAQCGPAGILAYNPVSGVFNCIPKSGTGSSWTAITNPGGNLSLTMGANTTLFTFNAATGVSTDLFKFTDTTNNTGTGALWHSTTASGSAAIPWQADANGVGWKVDSTGALVSVGGGGSRLMTNTASNTDAAGRITLAAGAGSYTFTAGPSSGHYTSAPVCFFADDTTPSNAVTPTVTNTSITLVGTGTDVIRYFCVGLN